jgi:hypothetical protein
MELIQTKPDVLVAGFGTLAAKAAKAAWKAFQRAAEASDSPT